MQNKDRKMQITTARAGLLCLPPTERQLLLPPAIEVRGTVSTEGKEFYNKANQRLDSKFGKRFLKGWYDVAAMAGFAD